jgi:hypothetical protein
MNRASAVPPAGVVVRLPPPFRRRGAVAGGDEVALTYSGHLRPTRLLLRTHATSPVAATSQYPWAAQDEAAPGKTVAAIDSEPQDWSD